MQGLTLKPFLMTIRSFSVLKKLPSKIAEPFCKEENYGALVYMPMVP